MSCELVVLSRQYPFVTVEKRCLVCRSIWRINYLEVDRITTECSRGCIDGKLGANDLSDRTTYRF